MRFRVNEGHSWAGDELSGGTVPNVVDEGLTVGGDKDDDRAVDTIGYDAVVEWQGDGGRLAAEHHLAEKFLELVVNILNCIADVGLGEFTEVSLELVIALVEKDSLVPGPTVPVLVRARGSLAEANIIKIKKEME